MFGIKGSSLCVFLNCIYSMSRGGKMCSSIRHLKIKTIVMSYIIKKYSFSFLAAYRCVCNVCIAFWVDDNQSSAASMWGITMYLIFPFRPGGSPFYFWGEGVVSLTSQIAGLIHYIIIQGCQMWYNNIKEEHTPILPYYHKSGRRYI